MVSDNYEKKLSVRTAPVFNKTTVFFIFLNKLDTLKRIPKEVGNKE